MLPTTDQIIAIARLFLFVREAQSTGQNRGLRVEAIQHWSAGQFGDSWCAEFVWFVLDIVYHGNAPIPRTGSTQALLDYARQQNWIVDASAVGDLYFYLNDAGLPHHVGIVTSINPLIGIAGNTSADGTSANGDRVAEHAITAHTFVHYLQGEPTS